MSPSLTLGRAVQVQSKRLLRRSFCSSSFSSSGEKIQSFRAKMRREIIEDVEKMQRMKSRDRNSINRLLTSWGMPNGGFRDKLLWGSNVAAIFIASSAVGTWRAKADRVRETPHTEFAGNVSV